jgi:hypothetical protein
VKVRVRAGVASKRETSDKAEEPLKPFDSLSGRSVFPMICQKIGDTDQDLALSDLRDTANMDVSSIFERTAIRAP